ncbi:MAG: aminotransferase class I/II-fold pyridoxal phosphate-dependent enzyme [Gemmatimonadota bacterium]
MRYAPFRMERYQSTYEHRVEINLSESGVHPLTVRELLDLAGDQAGVDDVRLGYGQSNGSDQLRDRIAALYPGATEANVLVTVGGAEANFTSFWHLMEAEGTAAVVLPNYGQVPGLLESFGSNADTLRGGARFVLVTNPNNPTGATLSPDAMDAMVRLAGEHGAWILADEVYAGAEVQGDQTPSFWGRYPRVLVTNSLSKAYGLPGLRLGWVLGPSEIVTELWGRTDYTTISPASLSDTLAILALEPATRSRILHRTRGIVRANLGLLRGWMDSQEGRFRYRPPDAGAICYVHYDAPVNSTDFAEKLRTEKSLLVVPGDHFGMDSYLRIGFGNPEDELLDGLGRIREAFDGLAP